MSRDRQIVTNVVTNAVQATPAGADGVAVAVRRAGPDALQIDVADRGPGLGGSTLTELMSEAGATEGGGSTTTSGIRASGLGLPIVMQLAGMMGGAATIGNRSDGPGTVFSLRLPLRATTASAAAVVAAPVAGCTHTEAAVAVGVSASAIAPAPEVATPVMELAATGGGGGGAAHRSPHVSLPHLRGVRVLAVDDSPANLRFAAYMLRRLGAAVTTASDGDGVVAAVTAAAAAGAPFDVCVTDMFMERVNGDAALLALRAAGHSLPVILSTANATRDDAVRYAALGFAAQLAKPFSPEQMAAALAAALAAGAGAGGGAGTAAGV